MAKSRPRQGIPTNLSLLSSSNVCGRIWSKGSHAPAPRLTLHVIFNYILRVLYLGCQWKELR